LYIKIEFKFIKVFTLTQKNTIVFSLFCQKGRGELIVKHAFFDIVLSDDVVQQLVFAEYELFFEAGFTAENLEKLRNTTSYKSALYYDALKYRH